MRPVAVDLVVDKLEHQVERLKGKLVGRSAPPPSEARRRGLTDDGLTAPPRRRPGGRWPGAAGRPWTGGRLLSS